MEVATVGMPVRSRQRVQPVHWSPCVGAVLAIALLTTPLTSAVPVRGVGTFRAPYSGATNSTGESLFTSTCAPAKILHPAHYARRTSVTTLAISSSASACSSLPHNAARSSDAGADLFLQIPIRFLGVHRAITLNWTLFGRIHTSVTPGGPCPMASVPAKGYSSQYCYLYANAEVIIDTQLVNATGTSVWYGQFAEPIANSSAWENQSSCKYTGTCTFYSYNSTTNTSFSGFQTFEMNITPPAKILRADPGPYFLEITIEGYVSTSVVSYPASLPGGASASGTLVLPKVPAGLKLDWIQVS
jgi:hypothetical protein